MKWIAMAAGMAVILNKCIALLFRSNCPHYQNELLNTKAMAQAQHLPGYACETSSWLIPNSEARAGSSQKNLLR